MISAQQGSKASDMFYLDLTVIVPEDILGPKGEVLFEAGTRVNPLTLIPNSHKQLLFIQGSDKAQQAWAKT